MHRENQATFSPYPCRPRSAVFGDALPLSAECHRAAVWMNKSDTANEHARVEQLHGAVGRQSDGKGPVESARKVTRELRQSLTLGLRVRFGIKPSRTCSTALQVTWKAGYQVL